MESRPVQLTLGGGGFVTRKTPGFLVLPTHVANLLDLLRFEEKLAHGRVRVST